ncbi:helix-turn-helix transcriptional regulator [Escherichia albertii]|nr:helix-turn-helix transcriptional regulator [Escherichia albertii]
MDTLMSIKQTCVTTPIKKEISKILCFIESNLHNHIKIEDIEKNSIYSARYIQRLFSCYLGLSPKRYIKFRRISCAAIILKLTKLSIVEIAVIFKFDSQQTFTREFKRISGYPPRAYRRLPYWDLSFLCNFEFKPRTTLIHPQIVSFNYKIISVLKSYVETLGENGKLSITNPYINKDINDITYAYRLTPNDDSLLIDVYTVEILNTKIEREDGNLYACFSFWGNESDYKLFLQDVFYMYAGQFIIKDELILERFTRYDEKIFHVDLFIPVIIKD